MTDPREEKKFTSGEVMTLVESFRNDIRTIAEDLGSVKENVIGLKEDMVEVKTDLTTIKDTLRIAIPSITNRVTKLEAKVGA